MQNKQPSKRNYGLVVILVSLILIILGLVVGIILAHNNNNNSNSNSNNDSATADQDIVVDTSEEMAGWEGKISDSTRAMILTKTIQDKLNTDPNYNSDQAVAEYQSVYDQATGDLKLYVAIEYANYIYQTLNNSEWALQIINGVKDLVNNNNELDYYGFLYNIYNTSGNVEQANYYQQLLSEKAQVDRAQVERYTE